MTHADLKRLLRYCNELDDIARRQAQKGGGDPVDIPFIDQRYNAVWNRINNWISDRETELNYSGESK